jgi:hypothetical protein
MNIVVVQFAVDGTMLGQALYLPFRRQPQGLPYKMTLRAEIFGEALFYFAISLFQLIGIRGQKV